MNRVVILAIAIALPHSEVQGQDRLSLHVVGVLKGHSEQVLDLAFSPCGQKLVSCGHDKRIMLWDVQSREQIGTAKLQKRPVYALAFSKDGTKLVTIDKGRTTVLWDVAKRAKIWAKKAPTQGRHVGWMADGQTIAVAAYGFVLFKQENGDSERFDLALTPSFQSTDGMAVSPVDDSIALGSYAARVVVWNRANKEVVANFEALPPDVTHANNLSTVRSIAFSPSGDKLAVASGFKITSTITLWDAERSELVTRFDWPHGGIRCVRFSPDGRLLAGCGDYLAVWDTATGRLLRTWPRAPEDRVRYPEEQRANRLAFSPNGSLIATAGVDGKIRLFSLNQRD